MWVIVGHSKVFWKFIFLIIFFQEQQVKQKLISQELEEARAKAEAEMQKQQVQETVVPQKQVAVETKPIDITLNATSNANNNNVDAIVNETLEKENVTVTESAPQLINKLEKIPPPPVKMEVSILCRCPLTFWTIKRLHIVTPGV